MMNGTVDFALSSKPSLIALGLKSTLRSGSPTKSYVWLSAGTVIEGMMRERQLYFVLPPLTTSGKKMGR
jgi:hypothetical protein